MKPGGLSKLKNAIDLEVKRNPRASEPEVVTFILGNRVDVIAEFVRDRVAYFVHARFVKARDVTPDPGPYQMFFEGFASLSERISLPGRGGKALAKATIADLRSSLKVTRDRAYEKAKAMEALIREMAPFEKTRRGLTVERYCELRAAGVEPKAATKAPGRKGEK